MNALIALVELEKPSKQTLNEFRAAYEGMTEGLDKRGYQTGREVVGDCGLKALSLAHATEKRPFTAVCPKTLLPR